MTSREDIIAASANRRRRARDGIIDAIAEARDDGLKVVLLLLLQVVEEIGDKIDTVLADERSLRQAVLNGYEPVHHKHHEWIAAKMAEEAESAIDRRADRRAARDAAIRQVVTVAVSSVIGAAGVWWVIK